MRDSNSYPGCEGLGRWAWTCRCEERETCAGVEDGEACLSAGRRILRKIGGSRVGAGR